MVVDVADRVRDGGDVLRVVVGDLEVELLLDGHDELDDIQRVSTQIIDEARLRLHFVFFNVQSFANDFNDLVGNALIRHDFPLIHKLTC